MQQGPAAGARRLCERAAAVGGRGKGGGEKGEGLTDGAWRRAAVALLVGGVRRRRGALGFVAGAGRYRVRRGRRQLISICLLGSGRDWGGRRGARGLSTTASLVPVPPTNRDY